jgi:hypothetical protein
MLDPRDIAVSCWVGRRLGYVLGVCCFLSSVCLCEVLDAQLLPLMHAVCMEAFNVLSTYILQPQLARLGRTALLLHIGCRLLRCSVPITHSTSAVHRMQLAPRKVLCLCYMHM